MDSRRVWTRRLRRLRRRVQHRVLTGAARAFAACDGRDGLAWAVGQALAGGALWVVAPLVSVREATAWHRRWFAREVKAGRPGPSFPFPLLRQARDFRPWTVAEALSARHHATVLVDALEAARGEGQMDEATYRRALARLARDADGQVTLVPFGQAAIQSSPWGSRHQNLLADEMAWWAVTRQAWRRDPTVRRMLTLPVARRGTMATQRTVGRGAAPIGRLLEVALGDNLLEISDRERATALVDACTWPELQTDGGAEELQGALKDRPCPPGVREALTTNDLGALLAAPSSRIRSWVLTVVLPAHEARRRTADEPEGTDTLTGRASGDIQARPDARGGPRAHQR